MNGRYSQKPDGTTPVARDARAEERSVWRGEIAGESAGTGSRHAVGHYKLEHARGVAKRILGSLTLDDVAPAAETMHEMAAARSGEGAIVQPCWSHHVQRNGERLDGAYRALREAGDLVLCETFHDGVYLPALRDSRRMFVTVDDVAEQKLEFLALRGVIAREPDDASSLTRIEGSAHLKIRREDILDVEAFGRDFGLSRRAIEALRELPPETTVVNSLHRHWASLGPAESAYAETLQMKGLANLFSAVRYHDLTGDPLTGGMLVRLMNSGFVLDQGGAVQPASPFESVSAAHDLRFDAYIVIHSSEVLGIPARAHGVEETL